MILRLILNYRDRSKKLFKFAIKIYKSIILKIK